MPKVQLNRKTSIPVKTIPKIVEWLLQNSTLEQLTFMNSLANDSKRLQVLTSIITNLTDYNVYEVFYARFTSLQELSDFRASKRGEVAGLKAFVMACQAARGEIERRKKEKVR